MAIARGTRFGSYEVAALVGVGGMGEVYRATDLSLKRDVALKVLPEELLTDANRLARLQREAEVLASLNHANVAQIYGLERSEGRTAIVMEFIDGDTLAERIAQGPLPSSEALFGPYQVAGLIGVGGMGEVYRATDTTLGREVAIKVLPGSFAADADRTARFEREAKTLASLNHTNIGQIFGLERRDGTTALVMELVEGLTLDHRLMQGPIPSQRSASSIAPLHRQRAALSRHAVSAISRSSSVI